MNKEIQILRSMIIILTRESNLKKNENKKTEIIKEISELRAEIEALQKNIK